MFKAVFAQPEHAGGELRSVLPETLVQAFDWTTLARLPGSFVDPELAERHTDLLFSVRAQEGQEALVYVLVEHQSTPDPQMPYRLLRYLVRIWERFRDDRSAGERLPAVVPVVLYHGERPWSAPRSLQALIDLPTGLEEELAGFIPTFDYLLDDLSAVSDEALRRRPMTAPGKLVVVHFKHLRAQNDPVALLSDWVDLIRAVTETPQGSEALGLVMRYIIFVNERAEIESLQSFLEREVGPEVKETVMTLGQRLIEQGIEQGVQQGLQQGEVEGERKLLLRQLRQRFGDELDPETERRIATAAAAEIEVWALRVLSAPTLDDVLAD